MTVTGGTHTCQR